MTAKKETKSAMEINPVGRFRFSIGGNVDEDDNWDGDSGKNRLSPARGGAALQRGLNLSRKKNGESRFHDLGRTL